MKAASSETDQGDDSDEERNSKATALSLARHSVCLFKRIVKAKKTELDQLRLKLENRRIRYMLLAASSGAAAELSGQDSDEERPLPPPGPPPAHAIGAMGALYTQYSDKNFYLESMSSIEVAADEVHLVFKLRKPQSSGTRHPNVVNPEPGFRSEPGEGLATFGSRLEGASPESSREARATLEPGFRSEPGKGVVRVELGEGLETSGQASKRTDSEPGFRSEPGEGSVLFGGRVLVDPTPELLKSIRMMHDSDEEEDAMMAACAAMSSMQVKDNVTEFELQFRTEDYQPGKGWYQVFVKDLSGKTITLDLSEDDDVASMKAKIEEKTKVPVAEQRLVFCGKKLEDIANVEKEGTIHLLLSLQGGGKRGASGAEKPESTTRANKPLKVAHAKIDAEEALKKEVDDPTAVRMMEKAKQFMQQPGSSIELCSSFSLDQVKAFRTWIDGEHERNGPAFYGKLVHFFADGYKDFRDQHEQWSRARNAIEKAFLYRMFVLFMTPDGTLSRESIKDALDRREIDVAHEMEQAVANQARQQDVNNMMMNPQVIAQMLQNPQVQALITHMMRGGEHGAAMEP